VHEERNIFQLQIYAMSTITLICFCFWFFSALDSGTGNGHFDLDDTRRCAPLVRACFCYPEQSTIFCDRLTRQSGLIRMSKVVNFENYDLIVIDSPHISYLETFDTFSGRIEITTNSKFCEICATTVAECECTVGTSASASHETRIWKALAIVFILVAIVCIVVIIIWCFEKVRKKNRIQQNISLLKSY